MYSSNYIIPKFSIFFLIFTSFLIKFCLADCDNLQDTCPAEATKEDKKKAIFINGLPCKNPAFIKAPDFKSSELVTPGELDIVARSAVKIATAADFAGLNTLGLSIARIDLEVDGLVVPHYHPRAAEMLFVYKGTVLAVFIDTDGKVFQNVLKEGHVMVFPKGLVHYSMNFGFEDAIAFSVLNSQNPGVVSIDGVMFDPNHDADKASRLGKRLIFLSKQDLMENHQHYYHNRNVSMIKFPSLFEN